MSKAKPLLFGAALGASAMFFAQQYHVVHSHDGLQVVPRTPQQSLGLAYADIRTWTPTQWTDRPELARALMAHGSTDLISESVAATLADRVSEDSSTLDELRGFLDGAKKSVSGDDSLLSFPSLDSDNDSETKNSESEEEDLVPIPFMQDTKTKPPADPFRAARSENKTGTVKSDSGSRFSSEDVLDGLREAEFQEESPRSSEGSVINTQKQAIGKSVTEQAKEMEERIFGQSPVGSSSASRPSTTPKTTSKVKPSESESMFEEVKTQLENRAQDALNRAQESTKEKARSTVESSTRDSASYVRDKATEILPDAAKNLLKESPAISNGNTGGTSLLDFDPFLE